MDSKIIAIDFDGVCVAAEFPRIGGSIGAESVLRELTDVGHRLILHTVRTDMKVSCQNCKNSACCVCDEENKVAGQQYLTEAIDWFKGNNIPLWAVNSNPDFLAQGRPSGSKPYADIYLDDQALSFPLVWTPGEKKPHADWTTIRRKLVELGYLLQ
jgi:hypothetical protein